MKRSEATRLRPLLLLATPLMSGCGAGTVTSEDVEPGEALVIGIVVVVALLYVGFVGGRGGR